MSMLKPLHHTPPQNIAIPLLSPQPAGPKPRDVRTPAECKYLEIKMCLSGGKLFINQNARFQYLIGNCSKSRASKFQNLRKKHAHNCGNGLELFPV